MAAPPKKILNNYREAEAFEREGSRKRLKSRLLLPNCEHDSALKRFGLPMWKKKGA